MIDSMGYIWEVTSCQGRQVALLVNQEERKVFGWVLGFKAGLKLAEAYLMPPCGDHTKVNVLSDGLLLGCYGNEAKAMNELFEKSKRSVS